MLRLKNRRIIVIAVVLMALAIAAGIAGGNHAPGTACAQPPDETKVLEAAGRDLPSFLEAISRMGYQNYGFKNESELEAVQLGQPVEVYVLTAKALEAYKPGQRVAPLLVPGCHWEVPLLTRARSRIMLTVAFFQGKWQAVEAGGIQLAERWQAFTTDLASPVAGGKQADRRIGLVRVYEIGSNFAFIESDEEETLVPLSAFGGALPGVENLKRYAPAELIPQVAEAVRKATEAQGRE
jgi:hypothetical protein